MLRDLLYPLKRLLFALRMAVMVGVAGFQTGWRLREMIHKEAMRSRRGLLAWDSEHLNCGCVRLAAGDEALHDDLLEEAGADVLKRTFGG
jgi:hypothetical protein